jgi:hypothetical protein
MEIWKCECETMDDKESLVTGLGFHGSIVARPDE